MGTYFPTIRATILSILISTPSSCFLGGHTFAHRGVAATALGPYCVFFVSLPPLLNVHELLVRHTRAEMPLFPAAHQPDPYPSFVATSHEVRMEDIDRRPEGARWLLVPADSQSAVVVATATPGGFGRNGHLDAVAFNTWLHTRPAGGHTVRELLDRASVTWTYRLLPDESLASYAAPSASLGCVIGLESARLGGFSATDAELSAGLADRAFYDTALAEGPASLLGPLYARLFPRGNAYSSMGEPFSPGRVTVASLVARSQPPPSESAITVLGDFNWSVAEEQPTVVALITAPPEPERACTATAAAMEATPRPVDVRVKFCAARDGCRRVSPPPDARGPIGGEAAFLFGWNVPNGPSGWTLGERAALRTASDHLAEQLARAVDALLGVTPGTSGCRPVVAIGSSAVACWVGIPGGRGTMRELESSIFPMGTPTPDPEWLATRIHEVHLLTFWSIWRSSLDLHGHAPNTALHMLRTGGTSFFTDLLMTYGGLTFKPVSRIGELTASLYRAPDAVVYRSRTDPAHTLPVWLAR